MMSRPERVMIPNALRYYQHSSYQGQGDAPRWVPDWAHRQGMTGSKCDMCKEADTKGQKVTLYIYLAFRPFVKVSIDLTRGHEFMPSRCRCLWPPGDLCLVFSLFINSFVDNALLLTVAKKKKKKSK